MKDLFSATDANDTGAAAERSESHRLQTLAAGRYRQARKMDGL